MTGEDTAVLVANKHITAIQGQLDLILLLQDWVESRVEETGKDLKDEMTIISEAITGLRILTEDCKYLSELGRVLAVAEIRKS